MNYVLFTTILVIVLSFSTQLFNAVRPALLNSKLMKLLSQNDFSSFDNLYSKSAGKLTDYDRCFLLLDRSLLEADEKTIRKCFDEFEAIKMTEPQQAVIYSKAFYFFLSVQDYSKCEKYYHLLKDNEYYEDYHNLDIIYNVYIEKGEKYLDELLEHSSSANVLSLISVIYSNRGDYDKAKEYEDKIRDAYNCPISQ